MRNKTFKRRKRKLSPYNPAPRKRPFKNKSKIKTHIYTKADRAHQQQTGVIVIKNVKGSPMGRREMIPVGNLYLHRGRKSSGNSKHVGRYTVQNYEYTWVRLDINK